MAQQQVKLRIGGMTCVHCAEHVTHALETVAGVKRVDLPDWRATHATVIADADVAADALTQAVAAAGYVAIVEERNPVRSMTASRRMARHRPILTCS